MLWYCSGYLGYLVMAHYIRVHLDWSRRRRAITGALCFLAGSAFTGWAFWHAGTPGILIETPKLEWAWEFCMPNVVIAAFGAFLLFSCIERKESPAFISGLSRLTFGMYLMHMFFLVPIAGLVIGGNASARMARDPDHRSRDLRLLRTCDPPARLPAEKQMVRRLLRNIQYY